MTNSVASKELKSALERAATAVLVDMRSVRELKAAVGRLQPEQQAKLIRRWAQLILSILIDDLAERSAHDAGDVWEELLTARDLSDNAMDALEAAQSQIFAAADKLLSSVLNQHRSEEKWSPKSSPSPSQIHTETK